MNAEKRPPSPTVRADQELNDARQRMEAVLSAGEVGTWTYEIAADRVTADKNMALLFGVSAEHAAGGPIEAYLNRIHPEDRAAVARTIGAAVENGEAYCAEYRIAKADGTWRHVIARGKVERDESGRAVRLPGVVLDISDRVEAEEARNRISAELAKQARVVETVLSSIKDFAYTFDLQGRFVYVNRPLLDLWGMELKDAVGKNFFELHYPEELAAKLQRQIAQVIATKEPLVDRTPYTSASGVPGFYEYIFSPVIGADGAVELVAGSTRDVSEQQGVLEALRRSEESFRQLADAMPQIVWAARPDGVLDYYNRRWFEYIDRKPDAGDEARWDRFIHPDDLERGYETWAEALRTGTPYGVEFRVKRADGEYRWFLVRALPIRDARGDITRWFGTCTDIHVDREMRARLERSESLFRQLADTIPQLAWMAKPNGWIFWYNQRWYQYTGTAPEQMEGWGWERVHHPDTLESVKTRWQTCIDTGEPFDMTFPIRGADGTFRPFLTRVMPFRDDAGQLVLWFGTNTDVSEQRRMMQERDELLGSERAARSEAERASRMKDEFLATLSHELRTPLNAIFGWAQLLKASLDDPETVAEGIDVIDRNVRIQTQLIEDLLDMSRIISGKLRLDVQSVDPARCIDAAVETVTPAAAAKEIRIEKILDPAAGPISGDPGRIQQIIWNLLSNAIKFTPRGGSVQVILRRVNSHLEVTVADSGQGISAEFLPFVFDRFRQADAATTRKFGGLGLGLAIVKQLVEMHGGTIRVASGGAESGTQFTINLPLTAVRSPSAEEERCFPRGASALPAAPHQTNLAGLRVLVVDDERDARELLRRLLEDCDAQVSVAGSAVEGLASIRRERPDLLVSDIGMADVDGYEFLRRVRAMRADEGGKTPAIALTAFARSEDRTRALLAGFIAHVVKPVEPSELVATIAAVAGRTGGGEG